jgi:hypothetical protein
VDEDVNVGVDVSGRYSDTSSILCSGEHKPSNIILLKRDSVRGEPVMNI